MIWLYLNILDIVPSDSLLQLDLLQLQFLLLTGLLKLLRNGLLFGNPSPLETRLNTIDKAAEEDRGNDSGNNL